VQTARAGHPYPLWVVKHEFGDFPKLDGISIGVEFGAKYDKIAFTLSPGEALLFITDGVIEAENEENELFGDDRLTGYFEMANGPPWAKGLFERIGSWRGNAAMNDDLTMVEIWRDAQR
jgi:sigma-B regulation protein RsbU (phosphoserine phosphatase)